MIGNIQVAIQEGRVDIQATIPRFLTPEKLLEINQKLQEATLKARDNALRQLAQEGCSLGDPIFKEKMKFLDADASR